MAATPSTRTNGKGRLLRTGFTLLIAVLTIVTVFSHARTLSPADVLGAPVKLFPSAAAFPEAPVLEAPFPAWSAERPAARSTSALFSR